MKPATRSNQAAMAQAGAPQGPVTERRLALRPELLSSALESVQGELVFGPEDAFVPPIAAVRSTLLASSLQMLRTYELSARYAALLPREYHEEILRTLAPTWLTVDAAVAHYRAMDALGLDEQDVLRIGSAVGARIQGSLLGTLARGVKSAGLTPWSLAPKLALLWSRVFVGGGLTLWKLGPKDARMAVRGVPLMKFGYFRHGFRGVVHAGLESITSKCYVRECRRARHADGVDFVISWS